MTNIDVNDFNEEKICVYKNETYSVRDNGAVLRHSKNNEKPRKYDNTWTFGKVNNKTGYMEIAGARVHIIVATAFHGEHTTSKYVVDHIDTNRQNNRPENLRWLTRLENILLNPITRKKIELLCDCTIEEILKEISILQKHSLPPDISWMGTVSQEEAKKCLESLLNWAKEPISEYERLRAYAGGSIKINGERYVKSSTQGAVQAFHGKPVKPLEFPCCPQTKEDHPLEAYLENLKQGRVFYKDKAFEYRFVNALISHCSARISMGCKELIVECKRDDLDNNYNQIFRVYYEDGFYIHCQDKFYPCGTIENGKARYFWPGEVVGR